MRIGIPDKFTLQMPTLTVLLEIYIVDCAAGISRPEPNCWDTIRNKLRGIDYVVALCGYKQSWSRNPALYQLTQHAKRKNKSKGSSTVAVTTKMMKEIIEYILEEKVYKNLQLNKEEQVKAKRWRSFAKIWRDEKRWYWYVYAVALIILASLGLRGCEVYQHNKKEFKGYGLQMRDLRFWWKESEFTKGVFELSKAGEDERMLHSVQVILRHSKGEVEGKSVNLWMGQTGGEIEPIQIIYHLYSVQKLEVYKYQKWKRKGLKAKDYVFDPRTKKKMKLDVVKKEWKKVIEESGMFLEPTKMRFHGIRKGWATSLTRKGIIQSLIAFIGRWKLQGAIYDYILHTAEETLQITEVLWYGKLKNMKTVDFDEMELRLFQKVMKDKTLKEYLIKTKLTEDAITQE